MTCVPRSPASSPFETERVPIQILLNGSEETLQVRMHDSLLDALREAGLVGAKRGCETGDCGACSVLLDGNVVTSCTLLALQADGRRVDTIEGLSERDRLHPLQQAFLDHAAVQCGFCIPGMLVTLHALLERHPDASPAEVREAMTLCRCTGYTKPLDAVFDYQRHRQAGGHSGHPPDEAP